MSAVVREEEERARFRHKAAGLECGGLAFCSCLSNLVALAKCTGDVILPWEGGTLLGNPRRTIARQSPGLHSGLPRYLLLHYILIKR